MSEQQKVLVIDDSIMIRKMVKSILAGRFDVLEASDGKAGLDLAKRTVPDLILLDFVMPKYNGYQTMQAIRKFDTLKDIPIIMISGLREQVAEHIPEPFVGFEFLEKPFEAETLISRIESLLHIAPAASVPAPATPTYAPTEAPPSSGGQPVLSKLSAAETLMIQGMENLVQREVVARINNLAAKVQKQESQIELLEQKLERISKQIDHQNKGLMVLLREIKTLQQQGTRVVK